MTHASRIALLLVLFAGLLVVVGCQEPPEIVACCTATPTIGYAPLEVTFDAACSYVPPEHAGVYGFLWSFGDGTGDAGRAVTHTFTEPGTYQVYVDLHDMGVPVGTSAMRVITVLPAP